MQSWQGGQKTAPSTDEHRTAEVDWQSLVELCQYTCILTIVVIIVIITVDVVIEGIVDNKRTYSQTCKRSTVFRISNRVASKLQG